LNSKNNCLTEALKKLVDIQSEPVKESSDAAQMKSSQHSQNANNIKSQHMSSASQGKKQTKRYELGPKEKCYVKIDNFYDENGDEVSFEEKRAKALGLLERNFNEDVEEKLKNLDKEECTEYSISIHEKSPIRKLYYI
jgi:hypothetical protein